jgi:hypothetical protein
MQVNPVVNALVDYCYGKDTQRDDVGAVARFISAHVSDRPAAHKPSRWQDLDTLKSHAGRAGPSVTAAQIDTALAAATNLQEQPGLTPHPSMMHP